MIENQKDNRTKIDGVPTGGTTASGNTNHDSETGEFKEKDNNSKTSTTELGKDGYPTSMTPEEKANHTKDKTVWTPHFEKNFLPELNNIVKSVHPEAKIFSVYDESFGIDDQMRNQLDRNGVDYLFNIGKGELRGVDLKTVQSKDGMRAKFLTIEIENWDTKVKGGRYTPGCVVSNNNTSFYIYQRLTDEQQIYGKPDCFMIRKGYLRKILQDTFFSGYGSDFKTSMDRMRKEFLNAKTTALQNNGQLKDKNFTVHFNKNDPNKLYGISRTFIGKNNQKINAKMIFKYENDGRITHKLNIYPVAEYIKKNSQVIDEGADVSKLMKMFNI